MVTALTMYGSVPLSQQAYAPCNLSTTLDEEKRLHESGQGLACPYGGDVDPGQAFNASALSIFKRPLDTAPSARGWFCFERNFEREREHVAAESNASHGRRRHAEQMLAEAFWDGPVFAVSSVVAEALNGIDEILDVGNGFVNTDFARRAALLPHPLGAMERGGVSEGWGVRGWVLPNVVVEHIESRRFGLVPPGSQASSGSMGPRSAMTGAAVPAAKQTGGGTDGLWSRSYGNYPLYLLKMQLIATGQYPLRAPNRFDLASLRDRLVLSGNAPPPGAANACAGARNAPGGEVKRDTGWCWHSYFGGAAGDLDPPNFEGQGGHHGPEDWAIYHKDEGRSLLSAHLSGAHLRAMRRQDEAVRGSVGGIGTAGGGRESDGIGAAGAGGASTNDRRREGGWRCGGGEVCPESAVGGARGLGLDGGDVIKVLLLDHCAVGHGTSSSEEHGYGLGRIADSSSLVVHQVLRWDTERRAGGPVVPGVRRCGWDGADGVVAEHEQASSEGRGHVGSSDSSNSNGGISDRDDPHPPAWRIVRALRPLCGESQAVLSFAYLPLTPGPDTRR